MGFLKLQADVANSAGEPLPGAVFLRGPSVGMLVMLIPDDVPPAAPPQIGKHAGPCDEEEERYVILTIQPRVPAGSLAFAELPAGMVDDDDDGHGRVRRMEIRGHGGARDLRGTRDRDSGIGIDLLE